MQRPTQRILEAVLEDEITDHLGQEKHEKTTAGNTRNGARSKAVLTEVKKRQRRLDQTHTFVRDFAQMLARRTGPDLPTWISTARRAQLQGMTGFTHGLTTDLEAVIAGLTVHWSSGGTEGAVNRIKKIKRQLYGRAGFELLRKMILLQ